MIDTIRKQLGERASLLDYKATGVAASMLHLPGPDFVDRVFVPSDRPSAVLRNLSWMFGTGSPARATSRSCRSTRASSTRRRVVRAEPEYFDPENIVELAIEGGCNAVARRSACSAVVARVRAQDPVHREAQPQRAPHLPEQVRPDHVRVGQAGFDLGAVGVGATIYFGSTSRRARSRRSPGVRGGARARACSPCCGATCATPASSRRGDTDYHVAADLTGQANHLGVTIEADIIKQKLPENNGGYNALKLRQDRRSSSTTSSPPTTRST
jgi:class I fructose-bisphosphate aldolase